MKKHILLTLSLIILSYGVSFSQRPGLKNLSYSLVDNNPAKDSKNLHLGVYGGFIRPSFYNTSGGYGFTASYRLFNLITVEAEYLDSKYFSQMSIVDSYYNFEEVSADEPITPSRLEFTGKLHLFKNKSTSQRCFYLRKNGNTAHYALVKDLENLKLYNIRASSISSTDLMKNYESPVKGVNIKDNTGEVVEVSALGAQIRKQTFALGLGITMIDNATIEIEKYGERSTKSIEGFYFDLLYSPVVTLSNVVITDFSSTVTEYNINDYNEKQNLGFRVGYFKRSTKTIGYVFGVETGIQPGIKPEKPYQSIYGLVKLGLELSFKLF